MSSQVPSNTARCPEAMEACLFGYERSLLLQKKKHTHTKCYAQQTLRALILIAGVPKELKDDAP